MGFQKGNQFAKNKTNPKEFADMIRLAVKDTEGDKTKLRLIAEKLTTLAVDGDLQAIKEIGDRIDGKAAQTVHNTNEDVTSFATLTLAELAARTAEALAEVKRGDSVETGESSEPAEIHTVN